MGLEQKLLQKKINNNEIIVRCCVTGLFRLDNNWIGFRLEKPYRNISHAYHPDQAYNIIYCLKYE